MKQSVGAFVQFRQILNHIRRQAIRPRRNRQPHDILLLQNYLKLLAQLLDGSIRVREGLKIPDVFSFLPFIVHALLDRIKLLRQIVATMPREISRPPLRTKRTAPRRDRPVPIRTREPAIQRNLKNLLAKPPPQMMVPSPIQFRTKVGV